MTQTGLGRVSVSVIVVDDGSPISADEEIEGLVWSPPFSIDVIKSENGGVARARNRGLDHAGSRFDYIAFLDSDDEWPATHLIDAIRSLEGGADFYFTDNSRQGFHASHLGQSNGPMKTGLAHQDILKNRLEVIAPNRMAELCLTDFPCQASTTVFRSSAARDLRFSERLKYSGEDVLFFFELACRSRAVVCNPHSSVQCGTGVNMYFSNLNWDSENYIYIKSNHLKLQIYIFNFRKSNIRLFCLNIKYMILCAGDYAFHLLRSIVKNGKSGLARARGSLLDLCDI
ncbi:glycosyltransferase family 2 protein [Asticcacaulis sp. DW145]|nr:glycosyltransferase family 2 protein [Asticcacaulis sp. DW145]